MIRRLLSISLLCASVVAGADEPVAELLTVQGDVIYPTNVAAQVSDVAAAVAAAAAAAAQADAVAAAATLVSNAVAGVGEVINSMEGVGYIRGYTLQFGAGIEADTNLVASIIKFAAAGRTATNSTWDIFTFYTEDPGTLPVVHYTRSLGRTNAWSSATPVGAATLTNILVGSTWYECYRNRVSMPASFSNATFRTYADVAGSGTNVIYLPVRNGVAVNGVTPLTATFASGTNVMRFLGGIRVQ
jgi:hypothetical protein